MIASLRGTLQAVGPDYLVIELGGFGLQVYVPRQLLAIGEIGTEVFVYTHLVVREDALMLYGFKNTEQRSLFETLISIAGVGPRIALAMLSTVAPDEMRLAVLNNHALTFTRVPGIGKKLAERLLLELKGKLDLKNLPTAAAGTGAGAVGMGGGTLALNDELFDLLVSLGYTASEASAAIAALPSDAPTNLEERLRLALRYFGSA
ncbi:MAG: Holliday junction branch migration protein RuvA [Chloroflexaceae bacterium]|nr:Holliday junction branch migration protein RuvA [Chloroflexaceae bacterium]NJO07212.1 Holliday junction branch migration protein RuvA [Chloroflexaceae bacterium]